MIRKIPMYIYYTGLRKDFKSKNNQQEESFKNVL